MSVSCAAGMECKGCLAFLQLLDVRSDPAVRKKEANIKFEGLFGKLMRLLFEVIEDSFFQFLSTNIHWASIIYQVSHCC